MVEKQVRKLKPRNWWVDLLAAIVLCGAVVIGFLWLNDYVRSNLLEFTTAAEGSITMTLPGEILVFRYESLLNASAAGEFERQVAEGERIKEGAIVGNCAGTSLYAPYGGVISYELDGWEERLQMDALEELDFGQTFQLAAETFAADGSLLAANLPADEEAVPNLAANRPVARLVDNLLDYTVVLKVRDERDLLQEISNLRYIMADGSEFSVRIRDRGETSAGDDYFVFRVSSAEEQLLYLRYCEVEVIAKDIRGVLVPSQAVTMNNEGEIGIYVQRKRKLVFTPVTELTSRGGQSVVEGIDKSAVIVTNPEKAHDGQRIY